MGSRSLGRGIETDRGHPRFRIVWPTGSGRRRHIALKHLGTTAKDLAEAQRIREEIKTKIRLGLFDICEYCPDCEECAEQQEQEESPILFVEVREKYERRIVKKYQAATYQDYINSLRRYWRHFDDWPILDIEYADVDSHIESIEWRSAKHFNNAMIPLRGIFELAYDYQIIDRKPTDRIKNRKAQKEPPDPFLLDEAMAIIDDMRQREHATWWNYYQFAFFSGLRPSEQIAIQWPDIDFMNKTAMVRKAKVRNIVKSTKTNRVRFVELPDIALDALKRQKAVTYLQHENIFIHPQTDDKIRDDKAPRLVLNRSLKRLGIRARPPKNTRHTFATTAIMAGRNIHWIAKQLGHSTTAMVLNTYSRWIDAADKGRELEAFNRAIQSKPDQEKTG